MPAIAREKRPAVQWKKYQDQLPKITEVSRWFAGKVDALCVVTGKVSGNLELLDFDHGGDLFERWFAAIDGDLRARLVIETSQSGGRHVTYRCTDPVDGNLKLAHGTRDSKLVTLIETRGEGRANAYFKWEFPVSLRGRMDSIPPFGVASRCFPCRRPALAN